MRFEKYKITLLFIENIFKSFHINEIELENTKINLDCENILSKFSNNKILTIKDSTHKDFVKGLNELISNLFKFTRNSKYLFPFFFFYKLFFIRISRVSSHKNSEKFQDFEFSNNTISNGQQLIDSDT